MDASKLESFTLTFQKNQQNTTATLQARALPSVTDLDGLYSTLKSQIMSEVALGGAELAPMGEDRNLTQGNRSIQCTLRFVAKQAGAGGGNPGIAVLVAADPAKG